MPHGHPATTVVLAVTVVWSADVPLGGLCVQPDVILRVVVRLGAFLPDVRVPPERVLPGRVPADPDRERMAPLRAPAVDRWIPAVATP